jgi:hypothetical protein
MYIRYIKSPDKLIKIILCDNMDNIEGLGIFKADNEITYGKFIG